ncbi:MAG: hypothetical protein ACHQ9S_18990 [Candidatus Binatia bacterium]
MSTPDLINGLFELVGGFALWANVKRIRADKQCRRVNWQVTLFFTSWGFWNLFYYPSLNQWASFTGGLNIVAANFVWLGYAVKYRRN